MNNYHQVIYGNYPKSDYPKKLIEYLSFKYRKYVEDTVLDLGCGDLTYTKEWTKWHFHVHGIDSNKKVQYIGVYKKDFEENEFLIDFEKDKLPYDDCTFDIIFTKSVIEHVANTDHFLRQIYKVLKPGGRIIILVPAWEYNYRWFYDDPTHIKPFHRKGLQDALRLAGFKDVHIDYFYHLPFTWGHPTLGKALATLIRRLTPDDWRWQDWEQQKMNVLIRFSKEVQLLGVATK